jgi:hypothetical protein
MRPGELTPIGGAAASATPASAIAWHAAAMRSVSRYAWKLVTLPQRI